MNLDKHDVIRLIESNGLTLHGDIEHFAHVVAEAVLEPSKRLDYDNPEVQKRVMLQYLQLMIAREDWHGVADAAMDLREMQAEART